MSRRAVIRVTLFNSRVTQGCNPGNSTSIARSPTIGPGLFAPSGNSVSTKPLCSALLCASTALRCTSAHPPSTNLWYQLKMTAPLLLLQPCHLWPKDLFGFLVIFWRLKINLAIRTSEGLAGKPARCGWFAKFGGDTDTATGQVTSSYAGHSGNGCAIT